MDSVGLPKRPKALEDIVPELKSCEAKEGQWPIMWGEPNGIRERNWHPQDGGHPMSCSQSPWTPMTSSPGATTFPCREKDGARELHCAQDADRRRRWASCAAGGPCNNRKPFFVKLDSPSETPSMSPSHAAATPIVARKPGSSVVAISCDQSLNSEASPTPSTVRFSQRKECLLGAPCMRTA